MSRSRVSVNRQRGSRGASSVAVDVWLIIGDSEAAQGGSTGGPLPNFFPPPAGTNVLYEVNQTTYAVEELSLPSGTPVAQWGIAGPLAWYRYRQTGRKQIVCDCAVSGTTSSYFKSGQAGYTRATTSVSAALAEPNTRLVGIVIYSGANDASAASPIWDTNWTQALSDLRSGIGSAATDTPVVFIKLPPGLPVAPYNTSWTTVRTQQDGWASAVAPTRTKIDQIDGASWGDIQYVHLDGQGVDETAQLIVTTLYGSIPEHTGTSPDQISDLHTWLEADAEVNTSGVVVDAWGDQNSSRSFTAALTARPTYAADGGADWNNLPTITYDGSNDLLQYSGTASDYDFVSDGTGSTVFVVFKNDDAGDATLFSTMAVGGGTGGVSLYITSGYFVADLRQSGGAAHLLPQYCNTPCAAGSRTFATFRFSTSSAAVRHRGSKWRAADNQYVGSPGGAGFAAKIGAGGAYAAATIEALIIYARALTNDECDAIGKYLTVKYNLEPWA